jgi:CheY-like chemotaxis protein
MPKLTGPQLAGRLAARYGDLRILYMSGYAESDTFDLDARGAGRVLLPKPITPDVLLRRVRETLDAETAEPGEL